MQAHHPFRHLLAHFETIWNLLRQFEQFWAVFSGRLGSFRAILSIFVGQVWAMSSNSEHYLETRYGIVDLGRCSKCLNWGCFETSYFADVNPTNLDPKTRSVTKCLGPKSWRYPLPGLGSICLYFSQDPEVCPDSQWASGQTMMNVMMMVMKMKMNMICWIVPWGWEILYLT